VTRLITALDFADPAEIRAFAARLDPALTRVKVGNEAFTTAGPALVDDLQASGFDVFLDLKYHDIPNTVANAVARAASLGVWMTNVHAGGGRRMLEAARDAVERVPNGRMAADDGGDRGGMFLIGVTVLTSLERTDLGEVGLDVEPAEQVARLATLVRDTGLDGVVCSPRELPIVRALAPASFLTVTPGIRPRADASNATGEEVKSSGTQADVALGEETPASAPSAPADDQRRTLTPREAILAGADHLVVGRPVTRAADPLAALHALVDEIDAAVFERRHTNAVPRDEAE